jgi:Tol biopolymer transport system component
MLFALSASADGRYIAYASEADNLVPGDTNGFRDVFVRDLASGTNLLVSADPNGVSGNGISTEPAISGDGRFIAFTSSATNLVAGDMNKVTDVFVRDLLTDTTVLASLKSNGSGPGNKASYSPVLSADGRWLLFRSQATDLASGTFTGTENLFLRDLQSGTNRALTTVTLSPAGAAAMTPDGRFVAFVGGIPGVSTAYFYVWDSTLNARVFTNTTTGIANVTISPDGSRLAYSTATELRLVDLAAPANWLVSSLASASRPLPRFSANGNWLGYSRYVAPWHQTFLYDVQGRTEQLVSHALNSSAGGGGNSDSPDLSPDGRFVSFRTLATNVVTGANGITRQIVLFDRQTGSNTLVSASRFTGGPGDDHSMRASFSTDGQTLLMQSWASDLSPGDFNHSGDVLARTILTAVILPPATPGQGPWLYWPFVPGNNYSIQFKNSFADPVWQDLPGSITNLGVKAWFQDNTPAPAQRLYRVVAF